jgi:hypothetical protein
MIQVILGISNRNDETQDILWIIKLTL